MQKVDPNGMLPNGNIVQKYIKGLKYQISPMVYARDPADLEEAMETATKISAGYEIAEGTKKEANLVEQVEDLKIQVNNLLLANMLATPEPTINNFAPRSQQ